MKFLRMLWMIAFLCFGTLWAQAQEVTTAILRVTVSPVATVSVNHQPGKRGDVLTFTVPADAPALIRVSEPGYVTQYRSISLEPGARYYPEFTLEREPIPVLFRANVPATIRCEGATLGITPYYHFFKQPAAYRIVVQAQGYQEQVYSLNLVNGKPQVKTFELVSNAGAIEVTSEPSGATLLVDGIERGTTPCTLDKLRESEYTLTLRKEGYQPAERKLKVAAGEVAPVAVTLERLPSGLNIFTIPSDARVYVDNVFKGRSDLTLKEVTDGTHQIRVEKEGYGIETRTVSLKAGETHVEEFRLNIVRGTLCVQTRPARVTVYEGNTRLFETAPATSSDYTSTEKQVALPPGVHTLTFKAEGYADLTREVQITANEKTSLRVALKFKPDFEVHTASETHTGVLILKDANGDVTLETKPGVRRKFLSRDIRGWNFIQP